MNQENSTIIDKLINLPFNKKISIIGSSILLIIFLLCLGSIIENVSADEIKICQVPISGTLLYWIEPGWAFQKFGEVNKYEKAFQVWFSNKDNQGGSENQAIKIIFNDAGAAKISGSARLTLPRDDKHLRLIHTEFGSMDALDNELILPTIMKVVFASGPLMSSFESYAAKKNDLIHYIEDQLINGIYKTAQKEIEKIDELTGKKKTITIAELIKDVNSPGGFARQEEAPFEKYGLAIRQIAVEDIEYEEKILDQISGQQKARMAVQTAIAEAKEARQETIKAEEQGKADYTKAKWEQEKINAKEIAEAQKEKAVSKLRMEKAKYQKEADILKGQGEAAYKRLVMQADGALKQKLEAWVEVNKLYAEAISKQKWVPETVISGGGKGKGYNGAQDLINLLMIKTAKDLKVQPNPEQ
jgi:hypothetical protein